MKGDLDPSTSPPSGVEGGRVKGDRSGNRTRSHGFSNNPGTIRRKVGGIGVGG